MANIKIQQLASKTTPANTDVMVIEDATSTKKIDWASITSTLFKSGSNTNGTYLELPDGTSIQYGSLPSVPLTMEPYGNGWRSQTLEYPLPRPIVSSVGAVCFINQASVAYYGIWANSTVRNTTQFRLRFMSITSGATGQGTTDLSWVVIGRWK